MKNSGHFNIQEAPRSFWLSLVLMFEVVMLTLFKPIWIFNLFLVGRIIMDFLMPGYFVPMPQPKKIQQHIPARAPIHRRIERTVGLG